MGRHEVCRVADLPPGERLLVDVEGLSIGVFNVDGEFHALANVCPHQLAPLCEGLLTGLSVAEGPGEYGWERDGEIVRCPWHGWEFDVTTGESVFNPHLRTRRFDVTAEPPAAAETAGPERTAETAETAEESAYGAALAGDEPPVDTYEVTVEDEVVALYV